MPNTDESVRILGDVNAAFLSSFRILNLKNTLSERFTNVTGQRFVVALHWRDDEDFVRSFHRLDLMAMDTAMCSALAGLISSISVHIKLPLHILLLGDIVPRKLNNIRHRIAKACSRIDTKLKLHTKTTLMPLNLQLSGHDLVGDDVKGQVSVLIVCEKLTLLCSCDQPTTRSRRKVPKRLTNAEHSNQTIDRF